MKPQLSLIIHRVLPKIATYSGSIKVYFYKREQRVLRIPIVVIVNELRSVLCNSKVKIEPYNVSNKNGYIEISLPKNIKGSLSNLIIVKTLTNIGLKYKCSNCKLRLMEMKKQSASTIKLFSI